MVLGFRMISGYPGRMLNGHTTTKDGHGWDGYCSFGISPWAIDYWGNANGLTYSAQAEEDSTCPDGNHKEVKIIMSQAEMEAKRGQWIWLWVETVWGHNGIVPDGSTRIWVAGEDTPRINKVNINTIPPGMGMLMFWVGQYHHCCVANETPSTTETAAPRFGRTPREAYEDSPVLAGCFGANNAPGQPVGRCEQQAPVNGNVPIPAGLRW
jgi:hypothetical protein